MPFVFYVFILVSAMVSMHYLYATEIHWIVAFDKPFVLNNGISHNFEQSDENIG